MAVIKVNYIRNSSDKKQAAKAHIRYIQHRPGRVLSARAEGNHMTHSGHSHCCELADMSNPERLRYVPTYHDLDCKIYTPEYWLPYYTGRGWPASNKTRNKTPKIDTAVYNPMTTGDSKAGTAPREEYKRQTRTLFGRDGVVERQEAYRMIDQAGEGSSYFRIVISPDPKREDTRHDLLLREITEQTIEKIGQPVSWVAAIHEDHTPNRHIHVLAIVKERLLPIQTMRQAATDAALWQRRELDLGREQRQEREGEEAAWEQSV